MDNKAAIQEILRNDKLREQHETLSVLDTLRKTRKSRGGVGAPLDVPSHLGSEARQTIILTDALNVQTKG